MSSAEPRRGLRELSRQSLRGRAIFAFAVMSGLVSGLFVAVVSVLSEGFWLPLAICLVGGPRWAPDSGCGCRGGCWCRCGG